MDLIYFFGNVLQFWIAEKLASSLYLQIKWTKFNTNNTPTSVGRRYCRNMATAEWNRIISVRSNGVHLSHSRQVAHVYYQLFDSKLADGDQLWQACLMTWLPPYWTFSEKVIFTDRRGEKIRITKIWGLQIYIDDITLCRNDLSLHLYQLYIRLLIC